MTWYYKEGDQAVGPVGKKDLQALINAKRINGRTLVRSRAMTQWAPLADVVSGKSKQPGATPPPSPEPSQTAEDPAPIIEDNEATLAVSICSQCGRSFTPDQVVTFDGQVICAACKPMFVQKLKEGVAVQGALRYAGFWIRFGAKIIDVLILTAVQWAILLPLGMVAFSSFATNPTEGATASPFLLMGLQQLIGIIIPAAYTTFFLGRFGATPGKMACGLRVVTPEGGKISYLRALGRNFAEWISAIILGIGYIMAAFDTEKRALHDRVCSTRVVRK